MDDMTILALAPRTGIRNQLLDDLPQHLTMIRRIFAFFYEQSFAYLGECGVHLIGQG